MQETLLRSELKVGEEPADLVIRSADTIQLPIVASFMGPNEQLQDFE